MSSLTWNAPWLGVGGEQGRVCALGSQRRTLDPSRNRTLDQADVARLVAWRLGVVVSQRKADVGSALVLLDENPRADIDVDAGIADHLLTADPKPLDRRHPHAIIDLHRAEIVRAVRVAALCTRLAAFDIQQNLDEQRADAEGRRSTLDARLVAGIIAVGGGDGVPGQQQGEKKEDRPWHRGGLPLWGKPYPMAPGAEPNQFRPVSVLVLHAGHRRGGRRFLTARVAPPPSPTGGRRRAGRGSLGGAGQEHFDGAVAPFDPWQAVRQGA